MSLKDKCKPSSDEQKEEEAPPSTSNNEDEQKATHQSECLSPKHSMSLHIKHMQRLKEADERNRERMRATGCIKKYKFYGNSNDHQIHTQLREYHPFPKPEEWARNIRLLWLNDLSQSVEVVEFLDHGRAECGTYLAHIVEVSTRFGYTVPLYDLIHYHPTIGSFSYIKIIRLLQDLKYRRKYECM